MELLSNKRKRRNLIEARPRMDGERAKNWDYHSGKPGQGYCDRRCQAKCFARFHNSSN